LSSDSGSKCEAYFEATVLHKKESFNPLNAELNRICHLLALSGAHHILHVSRIRVNAGTNCQYIQTLYAVAPKLRDMIVRPLYINPLTSELNAQCSLLQTGI